MKAYEDIGPMQGEKIFDKTANSSFKGMGLFLSDEAVAAMSFYCHDITPDIKNEGCLRVYL